MTELETKRTPLYDLHIDLGGKMVPFAGYEMPVQYPQGIKQEHLHTRQQAGLFDVSHMGQVVIRGDGVDKALEKLIPVDLQSLGNNCQTYGVFTHEQGGILDDLIITRWAGDCFFLVVNAACKEQDLNHLRSHLAGFDIDYLDGRGLMALQGPKAAGVMAELVPQTTELVFMTGCHGAIDGVECFITRSGYTGEDGFEISVPEADTEAVARKLLSFDAVMPIGLGARDSLRLEAGLCLYGHDINTNTTPVEGALSWSISKARRADGSNPGGFLGAETILAQLADGVSRKRVGLLVEGKAPVREGALLVDEQGVEVGEVTSGGFGPTLEAPVAMGYVPSELSKTGTRLNAMVRGKARPVVVSKTPFVPQRYFRG